MGENVEREISRWSGFVRALRREDREAFEELMDSARRFASEHGNATNPNVFEPMIMSIILSQSQKIRQMEKEIDLMLSSQPASDIPTEENKPNTEYKQTVAIIDTRMITGGEQTRLN